MQGKLYLLMALLGAASVASANNAMVSVDVNHCNKVAGSSAPFILVLKKNQPVMESITVCANQAKLTGASFSGIGQVQKPTLAYYNLSTKRYQYKNYEGTYQLVSLNGNISSIEGKQQPKAHAVISSSQFTTSGGYLNEAFTAGTVEITIIPFHKSPVKRPDPATGLNVIATG